MIHTREKFVVVHYESDRFRLTRGGEICPCGHQRLIYGRAKLHGIKCDETQLPVRRCHCVVLREELPRYQAIDDVEDIVIKLMIDEYVARETPMSNL